MPPKKKKADNSAMQELKRDLKAGTPKPVYLFYGEEAFLRDYYLGKLKELILPAGLEDFNLHTAKGKECSIDWIEQAADCLPMMSERTLVVVTDFDLFSQGEKGRDRLMKILSALPDYCTLVFVYDLLACKMDGRSKLLALIKKLGAAVDFQRQDEEQLTGWICRQFKKAGKSIDTRDAGYLVFLCGDLMHSLSSEIGKIASYADHPRVTREDIDAVAAPVLEAQVFEMTGAVSKGDFDRASEVLGALLKLQEEPFMLLALIGKELRKLHTARIALDTGRDKFWLMERWNMRSDYPARLLLDNAKKVSREWCANGVKRCYEVDLRIKSVSGVDGADELKLLLMELASGTEHRRTER